MNGIRLARLHSGLSQVELAEKAGITERTISYLEDGAHIPRARTLARLSRALGVDTLELLVGLPDVDGAKFARPHADPHTGPGTSRKEVVK